MLHQKTSSLIAGALWVLLCLLPVSSRAHEAPKSQAHQAINRTDRPARLLTQLKSKNKVERYYAARDLGHWGNAKAIPALLETALQDSQAPVRRVCLRALTELSSHDEKQLKSRAVIESLHFILQYDPAGEVRAAAAELLGHLKNKTSIPLLLQALHDPNERLKQSAIEALSNLRVRRAVPHLIAIAQQPGQGRESQFLMKRAAIRSLALFQDRRALPTLITLLEQDTEYMRFYAAEALAHFNEPKVFKALQQAQTDESALVRAAVQQSLQAIEAEAP